MKKQLLLAIFLIQTFSLFAYDPTPLLHLPKIYQDAGTKAVFMPKGDAYLHLSPRNDASASFTLSGDGELTDASGATPTSFKESGEYTIEVNQIVPKKSRKKSKKKSKKKRTTSKQITQYKLSIDGLAPKIKIDYANNPKKIVKGISSVYFGHALTVMLSATDEQSGVENIYYSLDQTGYLKYD